MQDERPIIEQIREVLKDRSNQDVFDQLYSEDAPFSIDDPSEILAVLKQISAELPAVQHDIIGRIDAMSPKAFERFILLRAGLLAARGNTLWLHYQIMVALNALGGAGLARTKSPLLLHAMLAMANIGEADYAQSLVGEVLSIGLLRMSPADCMRYALSSIDNGGRYAYWMIQRTFAQRPEAAELGLGLELIDKAKEEVGSSAGPRLQLAPADEGMPVLSPSVIELPRPPGDHHYLFREERLRRERPGIRIHAIERGTISVRAEGGSVEFYVFDEHDRCIDSLSSGFRPFIASDRQQREGALAMLSDMFSIKFNVCHFLLDHFTRIKLYQGYSNSPLTYLSVLDNDYCRQAYGLAGIQSSVYAPGDACFSVRADRLLMSSNLATDFRHPAHLGDDWALGFIRSTMGAAETPGSRRIFISREDATSRQILNWPQIEPLLRKHGFEIIKLDGLTVSEQIALFSQAGAVIGVHGAGLTNLVFSAPDVKVLEVLPPLVATDAYWILSAALGQDYHAFVADDPEFDRPDYTRWQHRPEYNDRDILIDPDRFEDTLIRLLH